MQSAARQVAGVDAITASGLQQAIEELRQLREVELPVAEERARDSRHTGPSIDNPELQELIDELERVEARITVLEDIIANAHVTAAPSANVVGIGTQVEVLDLDAEVSMVLELVGSFEADAELGRVSCASPIGEAINGLALNEVGVAKTPGGERRLKIVRVWH